MLWKVISIILQEDTNDSETKIN